MEDGKKLALADYIALVIIPVSIFAVYIPAIISGSTALAHPLEHDIALQWIPFKEFAASCLSQGFFPLWTTNVFAGMPFLAFSHTGSLYPFGWILLHDYAFSVNWFYPIHLIIAAYGMFFLLRGFRVSTFPSALAALCMVFAGKFFYFIHFLPSACSNPWSPWFFHFMLQIMRKGGLRHCIGLAAVFAMQMLGGDVESNSYQLIFAVPFIAIVWRREGKGMRAGRMIPIMLALLLGGALAAAQVIPLFEYTGHFIRAPGVTFEYFSQRSLPLELVWGLLYPLTSFEDMGNLLSPRPYLYLGIIPILFSIIALVRGSRPSSRLMLFLAVLALIYSFGSLPVLDWIIYHVPFLNKYGAPEHAFYLFQIFFTITAAQGLDDISEWVMKKEYSRITMKRFYAFICLVFFLDTYLVAASISYYDGKRPENFKLNNEVRHLLKKAEYKGARFVTVSREGIRDQDLLYHIGMRTDSDFIDGWITVPPLRYAKFMNRVDNRAAVFDEKGKLAKLGLNVNLRDGLFISAESMPLLDLLSLRYILNRRLNLKFASPFILGPARQNAELKFSESTFSWTFNVFIEKEDMLEFTNPGCARIEKKSPPGLQIMLIDGKHSRLLYGTLARKCDAEESEYEEKIKIPLENWAGKHVKIQFILTGGMAEESELSMLSRPGISNSKKPFELIHENSIDMFENKEALPRAFVAHEVQVIDDPEELLDTLAKMDRFSLRRKILLERHDPAERILERSIKDRNINPGKYKAIVNRVRRAPGLDEYRVRSVIPGMLFTSDQHLPGWRAEVDGKEWPVIRADYCFRAVFVPEGDHTVRIFYDPISFHVGLWTSIATILSIILISIQHFSKRMIGPNSES